MQRSTHLAAPKLAVPMLAVPMLAALALAACDDALDQRLAIVDAPRILAIIADPAEARPGTAITYRAIVGGPTGPLDVAPRWSHCTAPKPPTEDNAVSTLCALGESLTSIGEAPAVTAVLPANACVLHGPEVPPGNFRPRDPDPTGGFYQPLRADLSAPTPLLAFALSRITCKLPNAAADISREYDLRYVANTNPTLEVAPLAAVPAHSAVSLTASWPADSAESYLYFDQLAQSLVVRREAMRVSWFATAGALDIDATAAAEDDPTTTVSTTWHTPAPGPATLWFVLRDSRGGTAVQSLSVRVE